MSNTVNGKGRYALYLSLAIGLAQAQAADLYVSTSGSDSNPGTAASPFQTVTYAYSQASGGTTIHVQPGVYYDYTSDWGIHLGKSGSSSSPIVLHSETRGGAIIDGQNAADRNVGFYIDGSYNTVDGFVIRNCTLGGISIWANGNRIINNDIHNNGNPASTSTNGRDGVYSNEGTSGNYYANNSIHDNGRTGSNLDHGLYLCGQNESVINNLLYRNASSGLQIAGYTTVSNMKVYNNVMAWNGRQGIILWMALSGVDIKNNIIYENAQYGVHSYDAHGSGVVFDHNLNYGNGSADYDLTSGGSDYSYSLGTTLAYVPGFADDTAASFDPHLGSDSPCLGAGLNLSSTFTTDMNGTVRPASGAWDLGAYVYGSAPPVASGLSFAATSGALTAPFVASGSTIAQPAYTDLATGGEAVYTFDVLTAGNYVVTALVNAPGTDNNSFYFNVDAQPTDPGMIWDTAVTSGFTSQTVAWRGTTGTDNGLGTGDQYAPKVFSLTAGTHQLIVRGREANCQLGTITIAPTTLIGELTGAQAQ